MIRQAALKKYEFTLNVSRFICCFYKSLILFPNFSYK